MRCKEAHAIFWLSYPIMYKTETTIAYYLDLMWKKIYYVSKSVHNGAENHK